MNKETFFFILFVIWYFKPYRDINKLYHSATNFLEIFNLFMGPDYILDEDEEEIICKLEEPKPQPKYEDKYLNEIRKMDKEIKFDEQEEIQLQNLINHHFSILNKENFDNLERNTNLLAKIEIKLYETRDDIEDEDYHLGIPKEERIKLFIEEQKLLLNTEIELKYNTTPEGKEKMLKISQEISTNCIIKKRLEKLNNCYIIEHTPLGNVLMIYDIIRETFKFYSDNTIPYRYLEVVARKYVKQFNCRNIFVDMEEELKLAEDKWDKERKEKEEKDKKEKEETIKNQKPVEVKKKIFARFKSYNKESGTGHVNTAAPPKNSIPNKNLTKKQENEKIVLKEKANRYTYEGKFANFSFIKKIDRKVVDKKFSVTFADFKKNILNK